VASDKKSENFFKFSIIIPVLHEAERINFLIEHIHRQETDERFEIIVVDGDPNKSTIQAIKNQEIKTFTSQAGRAKQMNEGASIAQGEILIFLHADTILPLIAFKRITDVMDTKSYVGGAFDLDIGSDKFAFKLIAFMASMRSRLTRIPYGDQTIFIRKDFFILIGGYKEIPIMEDVEIMHRIKKRENNIFIIPERVITSPRRWEKEGIILCTLRNWTLIFLYYMGISPYTLSKFYKKDCTSIRNN
jgi:rSAM/selenodomain-associated transferase 2